MLDSPHRIFHHIDHGQLTVHIDVENDLYGIYALGDIPVDEPALSRLAFNPTDDELCAYVDAWLSWNRQAPYPAACSLLFN